MYIYIYIYIYLLIIISLQISVRRTRVSNKTWKIFLIVMKKVKSKIENFPRSNIWDSLSESYDSLRRSANRFHSDKVLGKRNKSVNISRFIQWNTFYYKFCGAADSTKIKLWHGWLTTSLLQLKTVRNSELKINQYLQNTLLYFIRARYEATK